MVWIAYHWQLLLDESELESSYQTNGYIRVIDTLWGHAKTLYKKRKIGPAVAGAEERKETANESRCHEPRVPEFRGYSDDYVCGNHCRVTRDAHAKAKNRRNQSSSTSALYLGFVSASLLLVGAPPYPLLTLSLSLSHHLTLSLALSLSSVYNLHVHASRGCCPRLTSMAGPATHPGLFSWIGITPLLRKTRV